MKNIKDRAARRQPPFEKEGLEWREFTRNFKHTLLFFLSLNERKRWMATSHLSDFMVFSCGHYVETHGLRWERENLDEGVVIYCVAGKGYYRQGGKEWTVKPGDLLYCFPMTHHVYRADDADPWTIHWMHVTGGKVKFYERLLGLSIGQPLVHIGIQPDVVYLFNMLYTLFRTVFDERQFQAIRACAQMILSRIAVLPQSVSVSPVQIRNIQEVLATMERVVDDDWDLNRFAAEAGVTPEHFSRLFKKVTGFSPIDYFLRLKIRKACSLLATTELLVKQIAFQLSFHEHSHFTRLFKKVIGLAPEQYRKSLMEHPGLARPEQATTPRRLPG